MRIFKPNKVGKPKPYIIIEMAQSHDGSIGMLHSMIDEISKLELMHKVPNSLFFRRIK